MTELSAVAIAVGELDRLAQHVSRHTRPHRVAVVTDSNVGPAYATRVRSLLGEFDPLVVTVPAGEANKTRDTWASVTDELLDAGLGRDAAIVALGGGVVGDLAGFVAATFMRGIPFVQVPTSLLAMIDAAHGGKTGVDAPAGKNLVGAFHQPAFVLVDPSLLATLPAREMRCGLAEAIKHGVVADAGYFARVAEHAASLADPARATSPATVDLVRRSIEIKREIVADDVREAGRRKILNFGHTLGHAIEAASDYTLHHGEAIAIGMVLEARLGERIGVTDAGVAEAIAAAARAAGLPFRTGLDPERVIRLTRTDKKARGGAAEYALPAAIGKFGAPATPVPESEVAAMLGAAD